MSKNMSIMTAIQNALGQQPTQVVAQETDSTMYYKWVLLNKLKGVFEIKAPEGWDIDYMLDCLLLEGKLCITDTAAGVLPLRCQPYGINVFERCTDVNIANPVLGSFSKKINVDCVVIYLFDDKLYYSYYETIAIFAQRLANCDSSIDVNLTNSKVAFVFDCADKKQADDMKLLYDKVTSGEPAVFYHNTGVSMDNKTQFFKNDVKNTFIADQVQAEKRAIYNEFLTQVGINNAAEEKRERLLVDEVNSNNDELMINIKYAYNNIKKMVKKANEMYPDINLNIKMPFIDLMEEKSKLSVEKMKEGGNDEPNRPNGNMGTKEQSDDTE